jgi:hypothetical protein
MYKKDDKVYCTDGIGIYYGKILNVDKFDENPYYIKILKQSSLILTRNSDTNMYYVNGETYGHFTHVNLDLPSTIVDSKKLLINKRKEVIELLLNEIDVINNNYDEVVRNYLKIRKL